MGVGLEASIESGKIPYEYYRLDWQTFAGLPYQIMRRPLNFIFIDTDDHGVAASFNYYNKALFASIHDESTRMRAKNEFREQLDEAFENIKLPSIDERRKFGIDGKKVVLETILSVLEDSIPLENRGSGMASLIKTQIALDKKSGLDVILMEEPENHLSFPNLRKMLQEISSQQESSQIIIATHNNMIASRLNLNHVLWITNGGAESLRKVSREVADFFVKADNNSFLQLLLSDKAILVEGVTEFLLVPRFYKQIPGRSIEDDGVSVISCNGISYERYLEIAKATNKRIVVITDNDKNQEKITEASEFNKENNLQHIFMDKDVENWTWGVCMYYKNKDRLNELIEVRKNSKYLFHGEDYGPVLGKMLNNKVDTAYQMLISEEEFNIPQYVEDAIEWLNK